MFNLINDDITKEEALANHDQMVRIFREDESRFASIRQAAIEGMINLPRNRKHKIRLIQLQNKLDQILSSERRN